MSVRLNPDYLPDLVSAIEQAQTNQQTAVEEMSTGKSVNNLSDNPAAAAALVQINAQIGSDDQFQTNVGDLQGKLQTADSALNSAVSLMTTAITVGAEGANGTLSTADRQALAQQVQGLQQQMVGLANTAYQGVYVFGGTAVSSQPFTANLSASSGVTYNGNSNATQVQVAEGQTVQSGVSGNQLFLNGSGNVFQALNDLSSALQSGNGIDAANTEVQQAFNQLSIQRVSYGNELSQLQSASSFLSSEQVNLSTQQSNLVGANMTQVVAEDSQDQVDLQAALAATGQVLNLPTLLSYLKS